MKIRKAAVSGKFYPSYVNELNKLLEQIVKSEKKHINIDLSKNKIIGALVPHAGYIYSAYQAVHFFEILKQSKQKFDTFVIVNPNHTGYGAKIALDKNDAWESPFGIVKIDNEFAELTKFDFSSDAHKHEHSGEVILPMLQYFLDYEFKILPITMSEQNFYNAQLIASRIHFASLKLNRKICFIASSDFSHFVNHEFGKKQDEKVINQILKFNSEEIINTVNKNNISMCGYGPSASLTEFAKIVSNNPKAELLKFGHSGEVRQSDEVVDYASILVFEDK
ncbi:MAG: AmmeMemoRadiSam system protein B [Bacteroidales bacterium]|nr:AmmeMemoRadiSam system protein B [Bacteroidales bacterium]